MSFKQIAVKITIGFIAITFVGCGPVIKFQMETFATLDQSTQSKQETGNISIEVANLPDNEYEKSFYAQPVRLYKEESNPNKTVTYFSGSTAFWVTIVNNTNHILRMRDARVIFIDPNSDEPKMAMDKEEILKDVESQLPAYKTELERFSKSLMAEPAVIPEQLKIALENITKKLDFINGFNREIMPGMRLKGILMFPFEPKYMAQGKISFIDMVSETDEAGNPTKKVRFDFRLTTIDRYWRYNSATDKSWVEIKKDEYDTGVQDKK